MRIGLLIALCIIGTTNAGVVYLKPIVLGSLIDGFRFSAAQAGFVSGIEALGLTLAPAAVALIRISWDRRGLILAGAALALLTSVTPIAAHAFGPMLLERFLAGFGSGLVAAAVMSALADNSNPDRVMGIYLACVGMASAILVPVTARVVGMSGTIGAYCVLAAIALINLLGARWIPRAPIREAALGGNGLLSRQGVTALVAALIYWTGTGALWAFEERIGVSHGFSHSSVGWVLGASGLASFAGAITVSVVALRYGRLFPVIGAIILSMFSLAIIGFSSGLAGFGGGALLFNFACLTYTTFLYGLMAALDPSGRLLVLGTLATNFGLALGPTLGGLLASDGNYNLVVWLSAACQVGALTLLARILVRDRPQQIALVDPARRG